MNEFIQWCTESPWEVVTCVLIVLAVVLVAMLDSGGSKSDDSGWE